MQEVKMPDVIPVEVFEPTYAQINEASAEVLESKFSSIIAGVARLKVWVQALRHAVANYRVLLTEANSRIRTADKLLKGSRSFYKANRIDDAHDLAASYEECARNNERFNRARTERSYNRLETRRAASILRVWVGQVLARQVSPYNTYAMTSEVEKALRILDSI